MLAWAEIVFEMERMHTDVLGEWCGEVNQRKPVVYLDLPDVCDHMDPGLVSLLRERLVPSLGLPDTD